MRYFKITMFVFFSVVCFSLLSGSHMKANVVEIEAQIVQSAQFHLRGKYADAEVQLNKAAAAWEKQKWEYKLLMHHDPIDEITDQFDILQSGLRYDYPKDFVKQMVSLIQMLSRIGNSLLP